MSDKPSVAMSPAEVRAFTAAAPFAALAVPDGRGGLVARLVRCRVRGDVEHLSLSFSPNLGPASVASHLPAGKGVCLLADSAPAYAEIKGVMLLGRLVDADGERRFVAEHASGFDFTKLSTAR